MKMTTYRPFGLNRNLDAFFNSFFDEALEQVVGHDQLRSQPALNVKETETAYQLELAAPGLHKEDFQIEVDGELLTIHADWEVSQEENQEKYRRREFNYRSFKREIQLPENIVLTDIQASYEAGILYVELPKAPETKPLPARKVEIK